MAAPFQLNYSCFRLPYRTDMVVPAVFLITPWHRLSRKHRFQQYLYHCALIHCCGNLFTEPLPRKGSTSFTHNNTVLSTMQLFLFFPFYNIYYKRRQHHTLCTLVERTMYKQAAKCNHNNGLMYRTSGRCNINIQGKGSKYIVWYLHVVKGK
jgi:hypothetical protein